MARRSGKILLLVLATVAACACAELPGSEVEEAGILPMLEVGSKGSVPEGWGDLVGVSNSPSFPELFQLWFQDEAGNIHMVIYDDQARALKLKSVLIERH